MVFPPQRTIAREPDTFTSASRMGCLLPKAASVSAGANEAAHKIGSGEARAARPASRKPAPHRGNLHRAERTPPGLYPPLLPRTVSQRPPDNVLNSHCTSWCRSSVGILAVDAIPVRSANEGGHDTLRDGRRGGYDGLSGLQVSSSGCSLVELRLRDWVFEGRGMTGFQHPLHTALPHLTFRTRAIVDALLLTGAGIGAARSVAARVGLPSRFALSRLMHREGLPELHELADWISLLGWVGSAERSDTSLFTLATRCHRNPAAAYRLVKRLTGLTGVQVRVRGSRWVLRLFLHRCHRVN